MSRAMTYIRRGPGDARANASTIPRPIPRVPPVMTTILRSHSHAVGDDDDDEEDDIRAENEKEHQNEIDRDRAIDSVSDE